MKTKLNRPWLTASDVERPMEELKEISQSWDEKTWNEYLDWFEIGRKDQLVSPTLYHVQGESIEKNIFQEFGYESCPELRSFCDRLLLAVPEIQQHILRSIFFDGKTQREIAFDIRKSAGCIAQNKIKGITTLKRVHGGEMLSARRIMKGTVVFEPENIKSLWHRKLSHPIFDQRTYSQSEANNELLNHKCAELRKTFQGLSDRSRQIIYFKFWCNLSISEIARKCSVGLNTVEQILDATVFKIKSRLIHNINEDKRIA